MLEAGRYYIGDLSVILSPEEVKHLEQFPDGYCSLPDGRTVAKFVASNGAYRTSFGNTLSVSIGVVGVVPMIPAYEKTEYTRNINLYGMVLFNPDRFDVKSVGGDLQVDDMFIDLNNDAHMGGELHPYI